MATTFGYSPAVGRELKFTQAATVKGPVRLRLALSGTMTHWLESVRSPAWAILPGTRVGVAVPMRLPLLPLPLLSRAVVPDTLAVSRVQYPTRLEVMSEPVAPAWEIVTVCPATVIELLRELPLVLAATA